MSLPKVGNSPLDLGRLIQAVLAAPEAAIRALPMPSSRPILATGWIREIALGGAWRGGVSPASA